MSARSRVRLFGGAATAITLGVVAATGTIGSLASADEPPPTSSAAKRPLSACTPGFWKNHPESWGLTGLAPTQPTGVVFNQAVLYGLDVTSLQQSLDGGGGPGLDGAARILLRASVAAWLNAAVPDAGFSMTTDDVSAGVNGALASADRSVMIAWAEHLDGLNKAGGCADRGPGGPPAEFPPPSPVTLPPSR